MADSDGKYSPGLVKIMDIVQTITTLAIGGVASGGLFAAISFRREGSLFNDIATHMFLVIFGYILIITQAVMSMNPTSGWTKTFRYEHKRNIHLAMQIIGAILAVAGSAYAMSMRNRYNMVRTNHGIMGIVTLAFTLVTLIGGLVHAFARNLMPPSLTRICHTILGCLVVLFIFVTYILGLEKLYAGTDAFSFYVTLAAISILGILTSPVTHTLRRIMR